MNYDREHVREIDERDEEFVADYLAERNLKAIKADAVVLDLSDQRGTLATLSDALSHMLPGQPNAIRLHELYDQIEAQTRPPKPPEPTGLGAVVEDAEGVRWVQVRSDGRRSYRQSNDGEHPGRYRQYADIDAARVLSDGVQP